MSGTLTVRAALAKCVREGLHIEISTAAESIASMTERIRERPVEVYQEPVKLQLEALSLLKDVGGVTPDPPEPFEVDLAQHRVIFLRVLQGQQRSYVESTDIMDDDERRDAIVRVQELDTLIGEVRRYEEGR
jgi:hypothetical protein